MSVRFEADAEVKELSYALYVLYSIQYVGNFNLLLSTVRLIKSSLLDIFVILAIVVASCD